MEKKIFFDMDGTIADLYGVDNWVDYLRAFDPMPYAVARPLVNPAELASTLFLARCLGWEVNIISWLSLDNNKQFNKRTRDAKREWLKKNIPFVFDYIHLIKYGSPKHYIGKGILIDDNDKVIAGWRKSGGIAIDAKLPNWLDTLSKEVKGE